MTLSLALLLEWLLGDPQSRLHPVALFGRWAAWLESTLYDDGSGRGALLWLLAILPPLLLAVAGHHWFGWWFDALLLWISIGWRSLIAHVGAVLAAEEETDARGTVAHIVSRDTASMSHEDARRAALESLAENASDAVVAPLFWFLLLGAPAAILYRMLNTLDAMWGYRNERYRRFGWWAAKADDVANWIPARLTAALLLLSGRPASWREVAGQAATHASPNAGWPEAALAHAAEVRLGGPVMRSGHLDDRPFYGAASARACHAEAAADAVRVVKQTLLVAAALALGVNLVF